MSLARLVLLLYVGLAPVSVAHAEVCAKGHHAVQLGNDTIDLQDYNCAVNGVSGGLRMTFFRVSEVVAGSLVMGSRVPFVDQVIGPVTFIENEVYKEVKYLFSNFGNSLTYDTPDAIDWSLNITGNSAASIKVEPSAPLPGTAVKVWYLSRLFGSVDSDGVLLRAPSQVILNTDRWPQDFNMTFDCPRDEKKFILCTTLWKYIGPADFNPITQDVQAAYRRAESVLRRKFPDRVQAAKDGISEFSRNFALYRHLADRNLPADFLYIMSSPAMGECGSEDNWSIEYSFKPLSFEFVVLENVTGQSLNIDKFLGAERVDGNFRLAAETIAPDGSGASLLAIAPTVLQSGGKAALALRMIFGNPKPRSTDADPDSDSRMATAQQTYQRIQSFPSRQRFTSKVGGFNGRKTVTKTRESFRPPSQPESKDYAYGPEVCLSGMNVSGTNVMLDGQAANDIQAISSSDDLFPGPTRTLDLGINQIAANPVGEQDGSCPILYAWREDAQSWIYHGKVLHLAHGPERAMTDRIALPSLRTHFRLAEEEPEASFIDHVRLNLTLRDGRRIQLLPRQPAARVISAYTAADIDFELPAGLVPDQVVNSEIEIAGYYRRYSEMLSADNDVAPSARQARSLR